MIILKHTTCRFFILFLPFLLFYSYQTNAEFFKNISDILPDSNPRLSYGVGVSDFNQDGQYEFIVTGFKYPNLALSFEDSSNIRCISEMKYIGNCMVLKYLFKYTNYKSGKFNNKIYFSGHIDNILSFLLK